MSHKHTKSNLNTCFLLLYAKEEQVLFTDHWEGRQSLHLGHPEYEQNWYYHSHEAVCYLSIAVVEPEKIVNERYNPLSSAF